MWLKAHLVTFRLKDSTQIQTEEVQASSREDARKRLRKKYGVSNIVIIEVKRIK